MKLASRTLFPAINQTLIFAVENMRFSWKLLNDNLIVLCHKHKQPRSACVFVINHQTSMGALCIQV